MDRQPLTDRLGDRLLAEYGGAAAAYSLRALNGNGDNVVRVRRASDNDEKDFTAEQIELGEMVNWVNAQTTLPLDLRELEDDGRTGDVIPAAAAYSLRNLSTTYTGNVVDVRRSSDDAEESFTAEEVSDGTLEAWVTAPVSSFIGNRMYFDGVDDNVGITAPSGTSGAIEVEIVSSETNASFNTFLGCGDSTGTDDRIIFGQFGSGADQGKISYVSIDSSGRGCRQISNSPVSLIPGDKIKVEVTANTSIILYKNDVLVASTNDITDDTPKFFGGISGSKITTIGARQSAGVLGAFMTGSISDLKIYDTDMTTVLNHYQGYGNTDADWEDQIGSNDGTVAGSPELFTGQGFDGTVSKWYDQSGNDNHAVQTTPANQPTIVEGGSLVTGGIDFDGVDDEFSVDIGSAPSIFTISSVIQLNTFTSNGRIFQFGTGSSSVLSHSIDNGSTFQVDLFIRTNGTSGRYAWQVPSGEVGVLTLVADFTTFTNTKLYWNGAELTRTISTVPTGTWTVPTGNFLNIASPSVFTDTSFGELIFYPSDQSDNRTAIEANIGETYGITGIPAYDNTVDGFVETWYDQSGNGNDATQSVAGNQPKIVDGGTYLGEIDFSESAKTLLNVAEGSTTEASVFSVITRGTNLANGSRPVGYSKVSSSTGTLAFAMDNSIRFDGAAATNSTLTIPSSGDFSSTTIKVSNTEANHYLNGAANILNSSLTLSDTDLRYSIGFAGAGYSFDGTVKEAIFYNSDQSANRTGIEANINAHYDIYA